MNKVELTGDVPDDGDGEPVGIVIARIEVLLSLKSPPVGEINALDLARTDAMTLGVSGWVAFRDPPCPDAVPTEQELVTVFEGTALCALILLLTSGVDSEALYDASTTTAPSVSALVGDPEQGGVDWATEFSEKTRRAAVMLASIITNQDLPMFSLGLGMEGAFRFPGL